LHSREKKCHDCEGTGTHFEHLLISGKYLNQVSQLNKKQYLKRCSKRHHL